MTAALSHPVDLYPVLPATADLQTLNAFLPALLAAPEVTALRYCFTAPPYPPHLEALIALAHAHDVALIAAPQGPSDRIGKLIAALPMEQIDGLHLQSLVDFKSVPKRQGRKTDFQLGCSCSTLDDAMNAGEAGADYISFPAGNTALFQQWAIATELPSVAELATPETAAAIDDEAAPPRPSLDQIALNAAQAGADFIAVPLLQNPDAPEADAPLLQQLQASLQAARTG